MISKDKGLAPLFWGLCLFWDIRIEVSEDPSDSHDFCLPGRPPVYVVMLPEPEDRQAGIADLLSCGNTVLVLDDFDVDEFRTTGRKIRAVHLIEYWIRAGTHASREREKMGIMP